MTNEELRNELREFGEKHMDLANEYLEAILDDDIERGCNIIRSLIGELSPRAWCTLMDRMDRISTELLEYSDEDSEKYDEEYAKKMDLIVDEMDKMAEENYEQWKAEQEEQG